MNLKVTCNLGSPLCGEPPFLDALLYYNLAFKMGKSSGKKFLKSTPLSEFEKLPIPLEYEKINNERIYCCSNPIYKIITEWHDKQSCRFETEKMTGLILPEKHKNITVSGGHYKARFAPIHTKLIDKVVWFCKGDKKEIRRLLKNINSIGYYRKIGYGLIINWQFEEIEKDYSFNADKILMKTLPITEKEKYNNYRFSFGSYNPPYWHTKNQHEIIVPV